jgi:hypothetical protein
MSIKSKIADLERRVSSTKLSPSQLKLLRVLEKGPLERFLMDSAEIKDANVLVKLGLANKGTADIKQASRQYVITGEGEDYLKSL